MFEVRLKTFFKDGREVETVGTAEHFVKFEDHYDMALAAAFSTNKVSYFYYLSWLTFLPGVDFEEWVKTIRDVDVVTEQAVPFDGGPSESSSPS